MGTGEHSLGQALWLFMASKLLRYGIPGLFLQKIAQQCWFSQALGVGPGQVGQGQQQLVTCHSKVQGSSSGNWRALCPGVGCCHLKTVGVGMGGKTAEVEIQGSFALDTRRDFGLLAPNP